MGKLNAIAKVAKKVANHPLTIGAAGGVIGNAIGGQYPTKPKVKKIKKALGIKARKKK